MDTIVTGTSPQNKVGWPDAHHEAAGLQLADLLAADDGQFGHDVFGIYRHFNRESRQLDSGFCPRFVTPQGKAAGRLLDGAAHKS